MVIHLSKSIQLERSQIETVRVCVWCVYLLSVSAQITTDIFSLIWAICMCVVHLQVSNTHTLTKYKFNSNCSNSTNRCIWFCVIFHLTATCWLNGWMFLNLNIKFRSVTSTILLAHTAPKCWRKYTHIVTNSNSTTAVAAVSELRNNRHTHKHTLTINLYWMVSHSNALNRNNALCLRVCVRVLWFVNIVSKSIDLTWFQMRLLN